MAEGESSRLAAREGLIGDARTLLTSIESKRLQGLLRYETVLLFSVIPGETKRNGDPGTEETGRDAAVRESRYAF